MQLATVYCLSLHLRLFPYDCLHAKGKILYLEAEIRVGGVLAIFGRTVVVMQDCQDAKPNSPVGYLRIPN